MPTVTLVLPLILSKNVGGKKKLQISASTLGETLQQATRDYGEALGERLFEASGKPKRLLNFYINGKNARLLSFLETKVNEGDEIVILPSVSGG